MLSPFPSDIRKIGLFSLSGITDSERLEKGCGLLRRWNLDYVLPEYGSTLRYLQASDEERVGAFNRLLADESIDMLMALRGGYGVTRILDDVDWNLLKARNIPICGYSDVTALLMAAYSKGCRNLFHGPMLCSTIGAENGLEESMDSFARCLAGEVCPLLNGNKLEVVRAGKAEGPLIPMNLSLLCALIGTPYMPDLTGCILAIEDVDEAAYAVDRMLCHLRSAGILKQLSGLIFGAFSDSEHSEFLPEIFKEYAEFVAGPVLSGLIFGHIKPTASIRFGEQFAVDTTTLN